MKSRLLAAGLLTIMLPFGAVACGADSTGELDKGELSKKLQDEAQMDKETADCAADALIKADFTEKELETPDALSGEKGEAFTKAIAQCMGIDPSLMEGVTETTE